MKICFVFTNFNNSQLSIQAINSIWKIEGISNPYIIIVDNKSEQSERKILEDFVDININKNLHVLFLNENIGYFPGLNIGIEFIRNIEKDFKYTIIGNNDLVFQKDLYFKLLNSSDSYVSYPVISPNLVTLNGIHQNPHVLRSTSTLRKLIYDLYFSNYYIAKSILLIARITKKITKRKDSDNHKCSGVIKMGYGACYILTQTFFSNFNKLYAPSFLMGEEAFLNFQICSKGLEIYYDSNIEILHYDHATIGKIPAKEMWLYSKDSYSLYRSLL